MEEGSDFVKVAENLVRHRNGTYYLRAKIGGKTIRVSLKTKELRVAKIKRDSKIAAERAVKRPRGGATSIREALEILRAELVDRPHIAEKTKSYGRSTIRILTDTLPLARAGKTWTIDEATAWWTGITKRYSASVANKLLSAVKRLCGIMIEQGMRVDDPAAKLVRMPTKKFHRDLPSREQMQAIISHVRMQKKRLCLESSLMIGALAFSGARHGELLKLAKSDIGPERLLIGSAGDTKSRRFRHLPISEPLQIILDEVVANHEAGPLFGMLSCRRALKTACEAVGVPAMRIHDLRHFFATWCIESGVDIPTVAKWLGHQDGGALAMRTYGHVRDDHSLEVVKRLK